MTNDDLILKELKRQGDLLELISIRLGAACKTLSDFTDEGASFRASHPDPITLAYLAIVGNALGDRLDGSLGKVKDMDDYHDRFLKAAALLARNSLQVVDEYRNHQAPRQAIEDAFRPAEG